MKQIKLKERVITVDSCKNCPFINSEKYEEFCSISSIGVSYKIDFIPNHCPLEDAE